VAALLEALVVDEQRSRYHAPVTRPSRGFERPTTTLRFSRGEQPWWCHARDGGAASPSSSGIYAPRSCRGAMNFDPVLTTMGQSHAGNSAAAVLLLYDTTLTETVLAGRDGAVVRL
jgi:hypothetical protein